MSLLNSSEGIRSGVLSLGMRFRFWALRDEVIIVFSVEFLLYISSHFRLDS